MMQIPIDGFIVIGVLAVANVLDRRRERRRRDVRHCK